MKQETTIQEVFSPANLTFRIPPYQRAYAWETAKDRKQVCQFLDDLKEHPQAGGERKSYFLGHFLFEREQARENEFFVIDGQQRLTTVVIFFHCLSLELAARKQTGDLLQAADGREVKPDSLRRTYVMDENSRRKLQTVDYDDDLMRTLILHGTCTAQPKTHSGVRLKEAMEYMAKRMREEESAGELIRWMELVGNAVVTTFEVRSKEQATQIFAFQNDRGKDLTNLEKLKAYLMHVVYVHSPLSIQGESIKDVERKFSEIYWLTEGIKLLKEDQVLAYHLVAFLPWGEANPVNVLKKELKSKSDGLERVEWIRGFCANLVQSFQNVTTVEDLKDGSSPHERLIGDVLHLNPPASWPLLLKLMHFHARELQQLEEVLRLMEITLFKLKFMKYKSINRLPNIAYGYQASNLELLAADLQRVSQHGFHPDWDFNGELRRFLENSHHFDNRYPIRYLLWKYENDLRERVLGWQLLSLRDFLNETERHSLDGSIEHIMPQNPTTLVHPEEFRRDSLHNLGNLVLMTRDVNSSLNNKLPDEKANSLEYETPFLSQQAVVKTIRERGWSAVEIAERKKLIVDFALRHWRVEGETQTLAAQP